jgi:hypothetical protein
MMFIHASGSPERGDVKTFRLLFEKQIYNCLGLAILLAIVAYATSSTGPYAGQVLGRGTRLWSWLSTPAHGEPT